jgi:hypothetical protein
LPREITRTIISANPLTSANPLAKKDEVKSQHLVNWTLSGEDRKKIDRAHDAMATFQAVSYDEYRKTSSRQISAAAGGNKQTRR